MRAVSELTVRSGARCSDSPSVVLHEGHKRADRIARGLGAWTPFLACSMRAASEPTESLGGSAPGNLRMVRPTRATSEPIIRSGAQHQRTNAGYQPIYKNISSNLVN